MADPISETLLENVQATLAAMAAAGGYQRTYTVEREKKDGNTPTDGKLVIYVGDPAPQEGAPLMHDEFMLPVAIVCYGPIADTATDATSRKLAQYAADVIKALGVDPYRNAKALYTHQRGIDMAANAAPPAAVVKIEIQFRTLVNDPYNQ